MLANMATSLILHKRIQTTTAKAKALRTYVEPLITKSKDDSTHSRRVVFSYLKDKTAVAELFRDISPKVAERPGGYTRILKIGNRIGDNADMCILELVDYNEAMLGGEAAKTKTTRRRRAPKKKDETAATADKKATPASKEKPVKTEVPEHEEKPQDESAALE
jgi:large subunit ribosomal protein L17